MFHYFRVSRNFKDKRGYKVFLSIFLVSRCRRILQGNALLFHYFRVSRNFKDKRGYKDFLPNFFCLTVPKKFVEESFTVSLNSGVEKFFG